MIDELRKLKVLWAILGNPKEARVSGSLLFLPFTTVVRAHCSAREVVTQGHTQEGRAAPDSCLYPCQKKFLTEPDQHWGLL